MFDVVWPNLSHRIEAKKFNVLSNEIFSREKNFFALRCLSKGQIQLVQFDAERILYSQEICKFAIAKLMFASFPKPASFER